MKSDRKNSSAPFKLLRQLEKEMANFTPAEHAIATYIAANSNDIAFETAASLAKRLDISPITVGRFCRRLGYRHFRDLKASLRVDIGDTPWLVGDKFASFVSSGDEADDRFKRNLEMEIASLVDIYALVRTPMWTRTVDLLVKAPAINIIGFQSERGLAAYFAHLLQYARSKVYIADGSAGNYADILASDPSEVLCIMDNRRYSEHSYKLCQMAKARGINIVIFTDKYCDWAEKFTDHVIKVNTDAELFWNSPVAIISSINLMANSVVAKLGNAVEERMSLYSELYQNFVGHVGVARKKK